MNRRVELDPSPAQALDGLWSHNQRLADAVEDALDWIEAEPVDKRARRRRFTNGMWAIVVAAAGEEWWILWEGDEPQRPVVRLLAEAASL